MGQHLEQEAQRVIHQHQSHDLEELRRIIGTTDGTTPGTGSTASDTPTPITRPGRTTTASSGPTGGTTTGTGSTASDTPTPITRPGRTTTASSGPTDGTTTGAGTTASHTPTPVTRPGRTTTGSSEVSTTAAYGTTTRAPCVEIELIKTLVAANLIDVSPNVTRKEDLISKGVNFTEDSVSFVIRLPGDGAVVRDVKLASSNVVKIEVTFILSVSGTRKVIRGSPTALPENEFPTEEVQSIIIKVIKTSDDLCARNVRLSVIVCSESLTTSTKVSSM